MGVFDNKVAIITGGTKGIGKATAALLVAGGGKVVINYGRDTAAAEETAKELGSGKVHVVQADAGSVAGAEKIVKETIEKFGQLDIIIANAGVLPMKDVEHTTEADFDKTFGLNVKGPYFLVQKALPYLKEGGSIILNSTSLCVISAVPPPYTLYVSSKGAIEQLTRLLSKDLGRKGVRVNCIAPGPTGTELFYEGKSEQVIKTLSGMSPLNRLGKPEEIASAIAFLASSESKWVTGQILRANGGAA